MGECSKCGKKAMTFTCRYCNDKFCSEHRLPENHDCEGLEKGVKQEKEETRKWFEEKKLKQETHKGQPKRPKSSLARDAVRTIKNNATYGIIAVTVLSFLLQASTAYVNFMQLSPALSQAAVDAINAATGQQMLNSTLIKQPWTLLTVMLLHSGFFHLFANMVTFYFFGSVVEKTIGSRETLKIYVISGLAASIGFVLFRNILYYMYGPTVGGMPTLSPAVGASGAVIAFLGIVAMLYPEAEVLLYFFIPMKIRTAVLAFGGLEAINLLFKLGGVTLPVIGFFASSAHLTGLLVGLWYGKKLKERYGRKNSFFEVARF
ncbi:rhomboid family intramembrane serine protease [Candidatus Nanohalovita haloferacivicina]|uniref:rhomboid family intramembrane serine protease n=1 Tax=Candidatus Nanohalovita haloferacivicina TaxID=2978046 RepID=UPI00325FDC44